jgi:tetraspanin-18
MGQGTGMGDGSGFGVGAGLMRCFLIVVNIFFGLFGFILLAGGCFLKLGQQYYMPFVDAALESLPELMASAGLANGAEQPSDVEVDFDAILGTIAIGLIILGLFLFILAILGCIGACCQVKVIMIVYLVVLLIMFLVQLILVILYAVQGIDSVIDDTFTDMIEGDYGGIDDFTAASLVMNVVMVQFKCCGAKNYMDFDNSPNWDNQREFNSQGFTITLEMETPIACCKFEGTLPSVSLIDQQCSIKGTANDLNNNMNTGCVEALADAVNDYNNIILGVFAGILVFQALLIIFVIALLVMKNKEDNKIA